MGYRVPTVKMFLVQHSTNGVARRVSLDSCRQEGIMILTDGFAGQTLSQSIKSILAVRFITLSKAEQFEQNLE